MWDLKTKLRIEKSRHCSGKLYNESLIPVLEEKHYYVKDYFLDGDAPKQFIKAYIYDEGKSIRKAFPKRWTAYIAKTADKWYPHESVIEYMINRIGQELGLYMNNIKMVRANGQIRFLSEYFRRKDEQLIHGADICGQYLEDMPLAEEIAKDIVTARDLFTYEFIRDALRDVFPLCHKRILDGLIKMITFDAITGNNDRHFYNWGVVGTKKKTDKLPRFAPIFDSARGLLWNWEDAEIIKHYNLMHKGGKKIANYIEEASPRISIETNKKANHFELIGFIKTETSEYNSLINEIASEKNENRVIEMLKKEFFIFFIPERSKLITHILNHRFKKIRSV